MINRIVTILIVTLIPLLSDSQNIVYVDFGPSSEITASTNAYNNIATSYNENYSNGVLLYDYNGIATDINLQVHDSWVGTNTAGTTDPDHTLEIPNKASSDYFYGSNATGNAPADLTGGFKLRDLVASKFYSLSFFASRMNVTDNRETTYVITGNTSTSISLNASNNQTNTAVVFNIQPDVNGEITVVVSSGSNNNNSSGFFYLNSLKIEVSDTQINQFSDNTLLDLVYPIAPSTWEIGKTVQLEWVSFNIDQIAIDYSVDGGNTFTTIHTGDATETTYNFTVPNVITSNAIIRLSSGSIFIDSDPLKVIDNLGVNYTITVLGSSTAAGSGPSSRYNAWVNKYRRHLYGLDTRYDVLNIAEGGFVTYNILPTGSTIPAGVNRTIDINKNSSKAIALNSNGVIINLPSNDAASGYPVADQITNYNLISSELSQVSIPLWVTTPQPRNFGNNTSALNIQLQMITETFNVFGNSTVDFWTNAGISGGNGLINDFESGDGVHANNEAHELFFQRMLGKGIHTTVKQLVDTALSSTDTDLEKVTIKPNPASNYFSLTSPNRYNRLTIYNSVGQIIKKVNDVNKPIYIGDFSKGIYLIHCYGATDSTSLKLIKN